MKCGTQSNNRQHKGAADLQSAEKCWRLRLLSADKMSAARSRSAAFTLAEALAALLFLAIVIPVAVQALHISGLAGEIAARKGQAVRIADRILNESIVTTNWSRGTQTGTVSEGTLDFQYKLSTENWPQDAMQLVTAEVSFAAQGRDYSVKLSTLANSQTSGMGSTR
jgi:hypothetical protein